MMADHADVDVTSEVLSSLLLAVSDALADAGRPIDRIVRSPGPPSSDCEQLAAWSNHTIIAGAAGPRSQIVRHVADVYVRLLRCVILSPEGIPSEAEVDSDGAAFAIDQWIIAKALAEWPGVRGCTRVTFTGILADQLSSLSSMTARITVELTRS